jgi:hypothetical protein
MMCPLGVSPVEGERMYSLTLLRRLYLNETAGRGPVGAEELSQHHAGEAFIYPTGDKAKAEYKLNDCYYAPTLFISTGATYSTNKLN